jgi:hypothetical protein
MAMSFAALLFLTLAAAFLVSIYRALKEWRVRRRVDRWERELVLRPIAEYIGDDEIPFLDVEPDQLRPIGK